MDVGGHYDPIWDDARRGLPDRSFEDKNVLLASTFECGNGCRFRRLANGRYALDIEPDPGNHLFSGSGCYFCFAALNRQDKPSEAAFEVTAADTFWDGDAAEEENTAP